MPNISDINVNEGTIRFRLGIYSADEGFPATITVIHSRGSYILRGWNRRIAEDSTVVVDHEAPLNEPLRIVAEVHREGIFPTIEKVVTVPSVFSLVGDPLRGGGVPVTIQSWLDLTHERAGKLLEISDSRYPVIIDGFELAPVSTITLIHNVEAGSASRLADMLGDRSPVRIRPSCPSMEAAWVSARSRRRRRFSGREDSALVDIIELVHTAMPNSDQQAVGNTLMDLNNAVPTTLLAISERWPSRLQDIALEDLNA